MLSSGEQLILCDMPELELKLPDDHVNCLEIQDPEDPTKWHRARLERFAASGHAILTYDAHNRSGDSFTGTNTVDLSRHRYRWLRGS